MVAAVCIAYTTFPEENQRCVVHGIDQTSSTKKKETLATNNNKAERDGRLTYSDGNDSHILVQDEQHLKQC